MTVVAPIEELKKAADKLWDAHTNPAGEFLSLDRHPHSWSVLLATTAREMEQAAGTARAASGDARDPLRWRQALAVAREVNAIPADALTLNKPGEETP